MVSIMKHIGSRLVVVVVVVVSSALALNVTRYKVVREGVQVSEDYVLQVFNIPNLQCAMRASVKGAAAFAIRVMEEGQVECSLLGPGLPDPASLPNSTTPGQTYRLWIADVPSGENTGYVPVVVSKDCSHTTTRKRKCSHDENGVYYLHPNDCIKYLRCDSGSIKVMPNSPGTILTFEGFVHSRESVQCACNGSYSMVP